MKINFLAVIALSLVGSGCSEALDVSGYQRQLAVTYENGCDSAADELDRCCNTGPANCFEATDLVVSTGSCNGVTACRFAGSIDVGEYSCIGDTSCQAAGKDELGFDLGRSIIGNNSCKDLRACVNLGRNGVATVGSNSCVGQESCQFTGADGGSLTIGDDSCNGTNSCKEAGGKLTTIGNGSCNEFKACRLANQDTDEEMTIGDGSCNGIEACHFGAKAATIGSGSCNCPSCCKCLPDGARVLDNTCNSIGECCLTNNRVNPNWDFNPPPIYGAAPEYDIALDSCKFTPDAAGGSDIGDITCTFTASGGIDHAVSSAIYENDCVSGLAQTGIVQDASPSFEPVLVSATQETSTYTATISLANSVVPADSGSISFCLKSEVKDSDGNVYDWIGQKIQLDINVDGTFSTDSLRTTTFDGNTESAADAGDVSFGVGIKRCDSNGNEITDDTELSLGENFFLCIEGNQSTVVVNSIRELRASKNGVTDLNLVATIGDGSGEGDRNPNTFIYGNDSNKVVVATRLPSPFFAEGGAVTLSGTANISIGGRRRLGRSMQATSSENESSDFSMDVKIAGSSDSSGVSVIKTTVSVFFGAVAAAMLV